MAAALGVMLGLAFFAVACTDVASAPQSDPLLRLVRTIELPQVRGRIDHLAFDPARGRLFVAALGNDTVEVLDTARGEHLRSLSGFHEPQGIALVPEMSAVAVANGDTGTLQLLDTDAYRTRWTVQVGEDADNVRYDHASKRLLVAAVGGLIAVDPSAGEVKGRLGISGHPESFQLEREGARVFANLPGASRIVVGNRSSMTATSRWPTEKCGSNYPMALDEPGHRLFVGCRSPASVALVETSDGRVVTSVPAVGDTDDLFYDADRRRLYVIGGEGAVDVFARDGDALQRQARVSTRAGARTGLWVASESRLYVAVPARRGSPAEIRVFEAPP